MDELAAMVAVDPSPEFLPRVRARIANEPPPAAWRLRWTWVAASALAAGVVCAVILARSNRSETFAVAGRATLDARTFADRSAPMPSADRRILHVAPGASGFSAPVASRTTLHGTESGSTEPEVLIDQREARALQRLIAGVREGRFDLSAVLQEAPPLPMQAAPIADIIISPIAIEQLAPVPGSQGERP